MGYCFICEHCEALEKDNDLVLCCVVAGVDDPVAVHPEHCYSSFSESLFSVVLQDSFGKISAHMGETSGRTGAIAGCFLSPV